jgi:hypothetical protein
MNAENPELWDAIKEFIKINYKKRWNAYYSGLLVQWYEALGGTYKTPKKSNELTRWFNEDWQDIGDSEYPKGCVARRDTYPVYRPTKRITKDTPLTINEIDPKNLKKQIELKQKIKGKENLPPFIKK